MTANCRSRNIARTLFRACIAVAMCLTLGTPGFAQQQTQQSAQPQPKPQPPAQPNGAAAPMPTPAAAAAAPRATDPVVPSDYVIGTDDVLSIVYWKDKDMSADAKVRPDGRIALPLINEVQAAGLTPSQLHQRLTEESKKYMEDANITIVVREINSRRVFITGEVYKPGPYPLTSATSVLQLISLAGGLREYANAKKIVIMRTEGGKSISLPFNYKDVAAGKHLEQNIMLKPGDTVVVP